MNGEEHIRLVDPRRWLVGQTPWLFLVEVAARGVLVYVVLLVAIRLMGKRVAGQLSLSELAVIVTLGAAIGVPIQAADRGVLPAVVLLFVAVLYQRTIGLWSFKSRRVELLTQGDLVALLEDGVMDLAAMRRLGLSRERVFAALRERGVMHLGQIARLYIETSGAFSVFPGRAGRPGLEIVPNGHPGLRTVEGRSACEMCGTVVNMRVTKDQRTCPVCSKRAWTRAVLDEQRT